MPKMRSKFVCQHCGYQSEQRLGRCPECLEYNTFVEEILTPTRPSGVGKGVEKYDVEPVAITDVMSTRLERFSTGLEEVDRVLGGGVVPGSTILVGGEPGIGKSTLLLQMMHAMSMLASGEQATLYITAEESLEQLALRAQRLGVESPQLMVLADTNVYAACEQIEKLQPLVVVVDSIQAMVHPDLSSSPGSVSQIRECTAALLRVAKERGIPLFLVGHVTKEGIIAGPKVLEHMVDTVVYMEGDAHYALRIIRATKNRFGPAGEVGVFKMTETGLECVSDPSEYLLSELSEPVAGNVIAAVVEGKRPLLLEVQALVAPTYFGTPRRVVTGADYNRVSVIIAVLERRAHMRLGDKDIYVNVAGGMRIAEPAMDLPIALAIASSRYDRPLKRDIAVFGEVGLGGEVRSVASPEQRFYEMMKLGFKLCVGPKYRDASWESKGKGRTKYLAVQNVHEAIKVVLQVDPAARERQIRVEQYSDADAEVLGFES